MLASVLFVLPVALLPAEERAGEAAARADRAPDAAASTAEAPQPWLEPGWVASHTRGQVGESRVLVLRLPQPAGETRKLPLEVEPSEALEVLAPLRVVQGHDLAYVRVRPLAAGKITLRTESPYADDEAASDTDKRAKQAAQGGEASTTGETCVLHVMPRTALPPQPEMVSPKPGAVLFGELLVGARAKVETTHPRRTPVEARLIGRVADSDSWEVLAVQREVPRLDVHWRLRAKLDAEELPEGDYELAWQLDYVASPSGQANKAGNGNQAAGAEQADAAEPPPERFTRMSASTPVRLVHPTPDELLGAEAQELAQLELPEDFRDRRQPRIREDPEASGGAYTLHHSARPPLRIPVTTGEHGGYYQMALVARSDYATGAHATVGIWFNEQRNNRFPERTPLLEETWHRVMVGAPVYVPPGKQWVTAQFMNDTFRRGVWDRNLFIDRLELLPITNEPAPRNVRIEWTHSPQGKRVPGAFEVRSRIRRDDAEHTPLAPTWLEVNGERVAKQISEQPRFHVSTTYLEPGENRVRLVMDLNLEHVAATHRLEPGRVATPEASFTWEPPLDEQSGEPLPAIADELIRITPYESEAWLEGPIQYDRRAPDGLHAAFTRDDSALVRLPEALHGRYDLRLYGRAESFEGHPVAALELNGEPLGELEVRGGWWGRRLTTLELEPGEKLLRITFKNPHAEEERGERTLLVSAVELRSRPVAEAPPEPQVRWHYPPAEGEMARADAFVLDVTHPHGIDWVRLRHEGEHVPGGFRRLRMRPEGRLTLPVYLRDVEPGEQTFTVQVRDLQGRTHELAPRTVNVSEEAPASPYAQCVHLLQRFGYGPEPDLLAELLLAEDPVAQVETWLRAEPDELQMQDALARLPNHRSVYHVSRRALDYGLRTRNPARFRLHQFWENHFSTWIRKVRAERKWREHERLREATNSRFRTLLKTSATSPAMLVFLDQHASFANRLNENYAREILELHTLGVDGGYTQEDVERLARLLTGFSITSDDQWDRFVFHGPLHDTDEQVILGYRFAEAPQAEDHETARRAGLARGMEALELLAANPSTARYIAQKLVEHYYAYPAPAEVVAELAEVYLETDGDAVAMLMQLARTPRFQQDAAQPMVTDPFDWSLGWSRRTTYRSANRLGRFLDAAQRMIMDLDTPDGYSYDPADWLDSSSLSQRWRYAELCANTARARHGHAVFSTVGSSTFDERWNQATLDHLAMMLLGEPLATEDNAVALEILAEADGNRNRRFALAATLVGQLPQAQLR